MHYALLRLFKNGGMAEWFKAAVLKTASRKSGTWVRILLPPPAYAKASAGRPST